MKRLAILMLALVLVLVVAGALWATRGAMGAKGMSDWSRCSQTCSTVMQHMDKMYAKMKVHEGDKQCWKTCWNRMGKGAMGSAAEMKSSWMENMPTKMRANQCAQACWRTHHKNMTMVQVKGWRSEPRKSICAN